MWAPSNIIEPRSRLTDDNITEEFGVHIPPDQIPNSVQRMEDLGKRTYSWGVNDITMGFGEICFTIWMALLWNILKCDPLKYPRGDDDVV